MKLAALAMMAMGMAPSDCCPTGTTEIDGQCVIDDVPLDCGECAVAFESGGDTICIPTSTGYDCCSTGVCGEHGDPDAPTPDECQAAIDEKAQECNDYAANPVGPAPTDCDDVCGPSM